MNHPIETIFGTIKKWLPRKRPGLVEAERTREQVQRIPPKPRIVGGVDEPGLRPLTRGERLHPFMAADGSYNVDPLLRVCARAGARIRNRIVCKRRELKN